MKTITQKNYSELFDGLKDARLALSDAVSSFIETNYRYAVNVASSVFVLVNDRGKNKSILKLVGDKEKLKYLSGVCGPNRR